MPWRLATVLSCCVVLAVVDQRVMAGNATIGLEIVEDLPEVDCVLIPYGGGALACGVAAVIQV